MCVCVFIPAEVYGQSIESSLFGFDAAPKYEASILYRILGICPSERDRLKLNEFKKNKKKKRCVALCSALARIIQRDYILQREDEHVHVGKENITCN